KEVSTADLVTTAGEVVTTTEDVKVTTAASTPQISKDELTRARGIIVQEPTQIKAKMEEEKRIAREKDEANIALIAEWDDV
nr:hypothetical protein [Tanacetum cinerariifolium]